MNCQHYEFGMSMRDGMCIDCWKSRAEELKTELETRKRCHRENEAAFQQMRERAEKAEAALKNALEVSAKYEDRWHAEKQLREKAEAACAEMRRLCGRAYRGIIEHHSSEVMREDLIQCPFCTGPCGDKLLTDLAKAESNSDTSNDLVPRSELDKANAAAAEMRVIIQSFHNDMESGEISPSEPFVALLEHALSTECGKETQELADIGRKWRTNSSLEEWFPITAEEIKRLNASIADMKDALRASKVALMAAFHHAPCKANCSACADTYEAAKDTLDALDKNDYGKGWLSPEEAKMRQHAIDQGAKLIERLNAKLAIAVEALERLASFPCDKPVSVIVRETLSKLKEDKA